MRAFRTCLSLLAIAAVLSACENATETSPDTTLGPLFDVEQPDVTGVEDSAGPSDASEDKDTAAPQDTAVTPDVPPPPDGAVDGQADGKASCPGAAGCPCKDNTGCDSGICIDHPNGESDTGKECAATCQDKCKTGYICAQTSQGGDVVSICVPSLPNLCNPCATSKECEALGYKDSACVDQGKLGKFCGVFCAADTDCPADFACADVTTAEGAKSKQCVKKPAPGATDPFGTCGCNPGAVKKKLQTDCWVEAKNAEGVVTGKCAGVRSCLATGLSACTAPQASPEVCDGADNDCDGQTDEATCDDKNPCTEDKCDPAAKACKAVAVPDGLDCDADGNACTQGDTCQGGACKAGKILSCDDKNPCTEDKCDPAKGCTQTPLDGVACDDENPCTLGDLCKGGVCAQGQPKVCDSGTTCVVGSCSLKDGGKCVFKDAVDGLPCDDGNACTAQDACKVGDCAAGKITDCEDGNACTTDSCDAKNGCKSAIATGKACDADGNLCTVGDACVDGGCKPGKETACDDGNPCTIDACDPKTGKCVVASGAADGTACDDGNLCTDKDACKTGKCTGATKNCGDANACTDDSCSPTQGCLNVSNTAGCDDGDVCTVSDACSGGACKGAAKACDDGNPCTTDTCDSKAGGCKAVNLADETVCATGKWCKTGTCVDKCAADCAKAGDVTCNGSAVVTCGEYDSDSCLDWSAPKPCASTESCQAGKCEPKLAPYAIVINEVLYDASGADNDVFLELYGPPGADLTGWELVGMDGGTSKTGPAKPYNALPLVGKIPADGYFVIAHPNAAAAIADQADQKSTLIDYQNGPDSIELRYGVKVVDAVGYGDFASAAFAGEGSPTVDPLVSGSAIGRDAKSSDSNDNSKDFKEFATGTPGAVNVIPNKPPTAKLVCPATAKVGETVKLDASGSTDPDGKIASYVFDFGDLTAKVAGTAPTADHVYAKAGTFTAKVVVADGEDADASATCTITVQAGNQAPTLKLACPSSGTVGQAVTLDASGSTDADGTITSFAWDFGDTQTTSGAAGKVTHSYAKAGNYVVKVEATDNGGAKASGTCTVSVTAPNQAPVAKLVCPASVVVGASGTLDASGSTDADGTLQTFAFTFSDGAAAIQGTNPKPSRTFAKEGNVTVTLTVTDDKGATDQATCTVAVSGANPPAVTIVKPAGNFTATQGEKVDFTVDATAKPGKTVASVTLLVDGQPVGTDSTAPYTFTYTVPTTAKTGAVLQVTASASDNAGSVGSATPITLTVFNDLPKASFTAIVSGALKVSLDASLSSDTETPSADLEVRYDYENDGTWDTAFSKTKTGTYTYAKEGSYTIKMEVRDGVGQSATTTRTVNLSLLQQVSGTVNTTTWAGTIVVTGNIVVPSGQILTVGPGTSVQFANIDANKDGKGDFSITVQGKLAVKGTKDEPVVFTNYGTPPAPGKGWDKILLQGQGSTIDYAVIEYADVGVDVRDTSTISNSVLHKNGTGVVINSPGKLTSSGNLFTANVGNGVLAQSGTTFTSSGDSFTANGASGLWLNGESGSTVTGNVSGCTISTNKKVGLNVRGAVTGLVEKCNIVANDYEGVRIARTGGYDPSIAVRKNNIYGNAKVGARTVDKATQSASLGGSGTVSSTAISSGGPAIELVYYDYSEYDPYGYCNGTILRTAPSQASIGSYSSSSANWLDISTQGATAVAAQVYKGSSSSSYSTSMTVGPIAYDKPGLVRQVSVITQSATIDLRFNYYGVFPAILPVVTLSHPTAANLQGFVGAEFDTNWSTGPYYGGQAVPGGTTWSGIVWLTGQTDVAAGTTLTIAAGTSVRVVNHDQAGDGKGDFGIYSLGTLAVQGTADKPVVIAPEGSSTAKNQWTMLHLNGTTSKSTLAYTEVRYGANCVTVSTGDHTFDHVTIENCGGPGLRFLGATKALVTYLTSQKNASHGVQVESTSGVTLDAGTVTQNGGDGVRVEAGSTSNLAFQHLNITKNTGTGLFVGGAVTAKWLSLSYNDIGVEFSGTGGGSLTWSDIKFNNYEGVSFWSAGTSSPNPVLNNNNIFGNAVLGGAGVVKGNWGVSASGSGTQQGGPWSSPNKEQILYAHLSYSEYDPYGYCNGAVQNGGPSGSALWSVSSSSTNFMGLGGSNVTALGATVYKGSSSSSYSASTSIPAIYHRKAKTVTELGAFTNSGTINCKDNYWGVFPDVAPLFALNRTDAIDYQGLKLLSVSGTGPQK